jgi:hypothetical protein
MTPLCLMWPIWRGQNTRSFEDCEISVVELKIVMFKSLYAWIVVYNSPRFSRFQNFLIYVPSFFLFSFFMQENLFKAGPFGLTSAE